MLRCASGDNQIDDAELAAGASCEWVWDMDEAGLSAKRSDV